MPHSNLSKTRGLPNFFLAGSQKSASTWLWHCFKEHPEIYVPKIDRLNYFNIHYYKGLSWYKPYYENWQNEKVIGDTTPSYLQDQFTPKRMYQLSPDAKIIFVLRNPIDRAFSHYWHEKRKGYTNYNFSDAIHNSGVGNYLRFSEWILTGFYHHWIQNYLAFFKRDQILILLYDDLIDNSESFLKTIFNFLEINDNFIPSVINTRRNAAPEELKIEKGFTNRVKYFLGLKKPLENEYKKGIEVELRKELRMVYKPENEKLASFLNRDLSHWV